jgi:hypothetical protein
VSPRASPRTKFAQFAWVVLHEDDDDDRDEEDSGEEESDEEEWPPMQSARNGLGFACNLVLCPLPCDYLPSVVEVGGGSGCRALHARIRSSPLN